MRFTILNKPFLMNVIKISLALLILGFIVKYLIENFKDLRHYEFNFNPFKLIISLLIFQISAINQMLIWHYITVKNKSQIAFKESITLRVYSEYGKYLPGKVFGYAMLLYSYEKEQVSLKKVTFCIYFEILASLIAAIFIFIFSSLFVEVPFFERYRFVSILFLVTLFIFIHPRILEWSSNFILKGLKKESIRFEINYFQILKIISLYIANWFIFGISFFIFIHSFYVIPPSFFLYITGSMALAGLVGLFAFFVPGGLGVKEGILTLALKEIIPTFFAGLISLSSRLWQTAGELVMFITVFLFDKGGKIRIKNRFRE